MGTFYVETYRPNLGRDIKYRVHRESAYSTDVLSPAMTAVFRVEGCRTTASAIGLVIEKAAGHPVTVTRIFPRADGGQSRG